MNIVLVQRLIKLGGASIGTAQLIIPIVKEIVVDVVRILGVIIPFGGPNKDDPDWDDKLIVKINGMAGVINDWVEKIKNAILLVAK